MPQDSLASAGLAVRLAVTCTSLGGRHGFESPTAVSKNAIVCAYFDSVPFGTGRFVREESTNPFGVPLPLGLNPGNANPLGQLIAFISRFAVLPLSGQGS